MIVPFVLAEIFLALYQAICLPLYGIPKVRRSSDITIDRHHPGYPNVIEKLICIDCGYGDGLMVYTRPRRMHQTPGDANETESGDR